jgi:type II secretory pathway component GspD/PulD (secretin)
MRAIDFARLLADESGRAVILATNLDEQQISGEFTSMSVDDIARAVARRLGASVRISGDTIFIGTAQPEDRAQLVRRVRRLEPEAIRQALAMFSDGGKSIVENDGLVIVSDRVEVLEQMAQALTAIEREESAVWIVQLHLIGWSRRAAEEFGVDVTPAAALAASLAFDSVGGAGWTGGLTASASLDNVLRLANDREDVSVVAAPMLVLLDGEEASFIQGDRVPVPRRSVSDQGTVTTAGFEYVQTGTQIKLKLRERSASSAKIELDVGMSDVRRMVEEAPVTGEETLKSSVVVEACGVYLVGSLSKERRVAEQKIGWQSGDYETLEMQVVQVWLEAFRVAGPLSKAPGVDDLAGVHAAAGLSTAAPGAHKETPPASVPLGSEWESVGSGLEPVEKLVD